MTTPLDALRAAGLIVHEALAVPPPALKLVQQGRGDLPGPLCQWLVDGEGGWWWITDGRANHAGAGDQDTLDWLLADARPDDPPRPNQDGPGGNRYLVGVEVEGNGNWSPQVHDSMLRGTRALLAHYQLRRDNCIAHKEWTRRKVDPAGIDMAHARAALRAIPPPPLPQPEPSQEDDDMIRIYDLTFDNDAVQYARIGNVIAPITGQQKAELLEVKPKAVVEETVYGAEAWAAILNLCTLKP